MQVETKQVVIHTITFTEEEMMLLYNGIGKTSLASRERAGMAEEQSVFFSNLFDTLHEKFTEEE